MTTPTQPRRGSRRTRSTAADPATISPPLATATPAALPAAEVTQPPPPKGKLGILVELLSRAEGARIAELSAATGWLAHSVRGAMSGALKARGFVITSQSDDAGRVYRIAGAPSAGPQA